MIDLTFHSSVSDEAIDSAFGDSAVGAEENIRRARSAYRFKWLKNAAGLGAVAASGCVVIGLGSFTGSEALAFSGLLALAVSTFGIPYCLWVAVRPSAVISHRIQDDPGAVIKQFLRSLLWDQDDWEDAYQLLAPPAISSISPREFRTSWEQASERVKSLICNDSAACSGCGAVRVGGIWSVQLFDVITHDIPPEGGYMRCTKCFAAYCRDCYRGMGARQQLECPSCGAERFNTSQVFHAVPKLALPSDRIFFEITVDRFGDDRVAHLCATTKTQGYLADSYKTQREWAESSPGWSSLGERGTVVCHFYNTGVRIGERWYLISALPEEGPDQPDS